MSVTVTAATTAAACCAEKSTTAVAAACDDAKNDDDDDMMLAYCISRPGDNFGKVVRVPKPRAEKAGFALIRVLRAGVCNTDLEILKGYMSFRGILGHEFVGIVEQVHSDSDKHWIGQRVCGDINVGCQDCRVCHGSYGHRNSNMSRNHCPNRTVLGILNRNGTMAEYLTLPVANLHAVPDAVSDEVAVFAEPLAAACRISEQGLVDYSHDRTVAILGDGKLGLMIAEVIGRTHAAYCEQQQQQDQQDQQDQQEETKSDSLPPRPILFGKHEHKLELVSDSGVDRKLVSEAKDETAFNGVAADHAGRYDVVVDATGSPAGLSLACGLCRPMGTLVLKSTCAAGAETFNAAPIVIDELHVVGSRCGPIHKALELLALPEIPTTTTTTTTTTTAATGSSSRHPLHVEKYITKTFPLSQAEEAIQCAAEKTTMKVQIVCSEDKK